MSLALADPEPRLGPSIWTSWVGSRSARAYETARSALAELLRVRGVRRILLPAYACASLADAGRAAGCEVEFFAIRDGLRADSADLGRRLRKGDAALAIDYFGRAPDAALTGLAAARRDVLWIEDRAQALDPGVPPWGDVVLYSPRKLLGVADGGILVADGNLPSPQPADPATAASLWLPQIARLEDPDGSRPQTWYAASQAREGAFQVGRAAMSRLTRRLLDSLPVEPEAEARRRNYAVLAGHLRSHALWPEVELPAFAPLAFPILSDNCEALRQVLAEQRIFCARHWADLPSPPGEFPDAHRIAGRCLSIPCDPRYSSQEMHRVGAALLAALSRRK